MNLHPDFHNVVIVNQVTDIEDFGKELNGYMTDPSSPETEYIPPNSIDHVIGSTGVLSQSQSTSVTLSPLLNGGYPLLCTVPGALAINANKFEHH